MFSLNDPFRNGSTEACVVTVGPLQIYCAIHICKYVYVTFLKPCHFHSSRTTNAMHHHLDMKFDLNSIFQSFTNFRALNISGFSYT